MEGGKYTARKWDKRRNIPFDAVRGGRWVILIKGMGRGVEKGSLRGMEMKWCVWNVMGGLGCGGSEGSYIVHLLDRRSAWRWQRYEHFLSRCVPNIMCRGTEKQR